MRSRRAHGCADWVARKRWGSAAVTGRRSRRVEARRVPRRGEVQPTIAGRPQHGYIALEITPTPPTIKVRGADKMIAALASVRTREISLEGRTETFTSAAQLVPPDGVEVVGADSISVHVKVDEELVTRKFPAVVVGLKGDGIDPNRWSVSPRQVEITLTGALLAVEKTKDAMSPVVKVVPGDKGREAAVVVEGLPPGVGVRISPERVKIAPVK